MYFVSEEIKVETLEKAEKIVLEHVNSGENYRDISQITFSINGATKRFNPSQITKTKAKYEESQAQNSRDPDKSLCFKMFRKGKSPADVVIETDNVDKHRMLEYLEQNIDKIKLEDLETIVNNK